MGQKRGKAEQAQVVVTKEQSEAIPFVAWFQRKVKAGALYPHQMAEIRVHFNEQGLKDAELNDRFDDSLKTF